MNIATITADHYLPRINKTCRKNTIAGYISSLNLHILPKWGAYEIDDLTPDMIQDWVYEVAERAGAGGAIKAYNTLRQVIRWAIDHLRLFVADPTRGVDMPRKSKYKAEVLTTRRLKKLVRGFVGHKDEPTLIVSAALGVRPGENYFLHWNDLNWRSGVVPIKGTLQEVEGEVYEYDPKTVKSERDCYLPQWALDRLHQIWVDRGRPKGRIIGDRKPSNVSSSIQRWIKRQKLPKSTMQNLRHTWGTTAANNGVPIAVAAAMMGHASIQTTYRYYYALGKAAAKRAQRKVARAVLGKTCDDMYKGIIVRPAFAAA